MSVLFLKNIVAEGPGTIERFLGESAIPFKLVELGEGELAPSLDGFDTLIMLGGPMAVYEAEEYTFLKEGFKTIEAALKKDMRVLGVCLGAQSLAHVLGARVYKADVKELGWLDIELTKEGVEDPVAGSLAADGSVVKVFQWHGDTFDIPSGAKRLARSEQVENQAFVYGDNAYGLQFHIEATPAMIADWFKDEPGGADVLRDSELYYEPLDKKAKVFFDRFFSDRKSGRG